MTALTRPKDSRSGVTIGLPHKQLPLIAPPAKVVEDTPNEELFITFQPDNPCQTRLDFDQADLQ